MSVKFKKGNIMKYTFAILILFISSCSLADNTTNKSLSSLSETKNTQNKALLKTKPIRVSPVTQSNRVLPNINRKRSISNKSLLVK